MRTKLTISILLLSISSLIFAQKHTISGYITDRTTGETLIGATVAVAGESNTGKSTNGYGFFSLNLPEGKYRLTASYLGYTKYETEINLKENKSVNIGLEPTGNTLNEVVVTGVSDNHRVTEAQMGVEKISPATANKLPVIFGERDILKTMQLLPGVKSGGDGQSGFTVRGGTMDQNLIQLDDATVYNASHLLGFFSTFNSDAIKDVDIFKGTAPAQYGGRISSVVDVKMNEGNNQNYAVSGGIGLISSKLSLEGPIQKGKSSFLVSGRRTYADLFLNFDQKYKGYQLYFYDLNLKANYRFSDIDRLYISGYFGRDVLAIPKIFGFDWGNKTATLRWNHLFNSKFFANTSLIYNDYSYNIDATFSNISFSILSQIKDWNLKQEFQYYPNSNNEWKIGYNVIYHTINPGQIKSDIIKVDAPDLKDGLESAVYIANNWEVASNIKINYGLRISDFDVLGGHTYYNLDANKNIESTIQGSKSVANYFNLEPRLSLSYILSDVSSIKAAYTRNTQNMHLITNSVSGSPTDKWVMNTNNIKPEISDQVSLGTFMNFNENMYEFSLEGYYKKMQNQIDYKDNANMQNQDIETQLLFGKGRAYGAEFLLKKNKGRLTGWLGYTLSRTEKQIDGINNNDWYVARQDRTHDVSIVLMYEFSKKINVSAVWVYQTGNAVSFPSGSYSVYGNKLWLYTERNGYRMPAYQRLDLGFNWKLKETQHFTSELAFSVYNAYGQENPYIITFEQNKEHPNKTDVVQTALFKQIPSVSWIFKFK
jgi:CarboxypepD_reg-like domain/TonB-dependent Receptor Plug Domain